jgi:hypothetical protein
MLQSPELASQPLNFKQMAVPFTLKQMGTDITAPLSDAANRDAALDGYALALSKRAGRTRQDNEAKIQEMQAELQRIFEEKQAEMESLRTEASEHERQAAEFMQRKAQEEKRMADLVAPFLSGNANPVTVGNVPADNSEEVNFTQQGNNDRTC